MSTPADDEVLLIEDHPPTAALIRTILVEAGFPNVSVVGTARQAQTAIASRLPSLVLLDLGLPDADGVTVIERSRATAFGKPIIVLTAMTREDDVLRALRAGADGYLFKEDLHHELVPGLRQVARGGAPLSGGAARAALLALRHRNRPAPISHLTKRELQVLESLSSGGGYAEVAKELGVEINTVRTHVRALYEKLGVKNRAEAVNLGWSQGLLRART